MQDQRICCSAIFDKEATKGLEDLKPQPPSRRHSNERRPRYDFDKRDVPYPKPQELSCQLRSRKNYVPHVAAPICEWVQLEEKSNVNQHEWKVIEVCAGSSYNANSQIYNNYSYGSKSYLGKNPMTQTQWRRYQRKNKADLEA